MEQHHERPEHRLEDSDLTPYQRFMHKALTYLMELNTIELIVAVAHLSLTFIAVFGLTAGCTHGGGNP